MTESDHGHRLLVVGLMASRMKMPCALRIRLSLVSQSMARLSPLQTEQPFPPMLAERSQEHLRQSPPWRLRQSLLAVQSMAPRTQSAPWLLHQSQQWRLLMAHQMPASIWLPRLCQ